MSKAYRSLDQKDGADEIEVEAGLAGLSRTAASIERVAAGAILCGVFGVVMLNVVARGIGSPIVWADELAIYGMAWAALIGASAGLANRDHIAVSLLPDMLTRRKRKLLARCTDLVLLVLLGVLAVVIWNWFDPVAFLSAESGDAYAAATFNFMHQEPTTTLAFSKIWVWLVLPVFNAMALFHVVARLLARARV